MKVTPIIYRTCFDCSDIENGDIVKTRQYLREIFIPGGHGCFSRNRPMPTYICGKCGSENRG